MTSCQPLASIRELDDVYVLELDFSVLAEFYLENVVETEFVDEGYGHVETIWVKSHA